MPRKALTRIFMFTMFFSGGLIPSYMVVVKLGIYDTIWAMLLPSAVHVMYIIIMRTYFQTSIPQSLHEAAELDGANTAQVLWHIVLPLSGPILAVMALYYGVGKWNSYFDAMIYLNSASKQPLQLVLRSILIQNQPESGMISDMQSTAARAQLAELLKYATIIISSLPLLIMYPFFQKYFDSGIMVGSVKG
jgi:putative aldouronate transport system permease protein